MAKDSRLDTTENLENATQLEEENEEEELGKLRRLLHYLKGTMDMKRITKQILQNWVDA